MARSFDPRMVSGVVALSGMVRASADIRFMLMGRALAGLGVPLIPIGIAVLRDTVPRDRVGTAVV
ncbi:hypothetical protein [Arthrobacter sp. 3Tela_A]|uniref:hypothetical protein n=1 Tax=Arthrobacter sp. 3Tela_A TaxID=3093743 RepID=UPI003BB5370A